MNDGISRDLFSVAYRKVDDIIDGIMLFGRGALLAKFDMKSACRIVPVHPDDRYLLGMQWRGKDIIDMALPFDLPSAPYIFSLVAELAEWILKENRYQLSSFNDINFLLHYLDNLHTLGLPNSQICKHNLDTCSDV